MRLQKNLCEFETLFNCLVTSFSHLWNGADDTYCTGLDKELSEKHPQLNLDSILTIMQLVAESCQKGR